MGMRRRVVPGSPRRRRCLRGSGLLEVPAQDGSQESHSGLRRPPQGPAPGRCALFFVQLSPLSAV